MKKSLYTYLSLIFIVTLLGISFYYFLPSNNSKNTNEKAKNTASLIEEKELINVLKKDNDNDYLSEVPTIKNYYNDEKNNDFFIYLTLKEKANKCEKISNEDYKKLCLSIYNDIVTRKKERSIDIKNTLTKNKDKLKYSDKEYIDDFTKLLYSITKKSCSINTELSSYLSCKKILDKDFDVEKYFIKYSTLERSSKSYIKENYKKLLSEWGLGKDDDFVNFIEKSIIENINNNNTANPK